MLEQVAAWGIGIGLAVALGALTIVLFRLRLDGASRLASAGAWTGGCVDPQQSRAWSALVIDDAGITVRSLWTSKVRYAYRWSEIDVAASGRHELRVGLRRAEGLRIALVAGSHVDLLLPSRNLLRYPEARVDGALAAMRQRG